MAGNTATTIEHEVLFEDVTPAQVYTAILDSRQHGAMTGGGAEIDPTVGGAFTAWDGYISGTTLELVPNQRIVQSWRTAEWPDGAADSRVEFILASVAGGTRLTFRHTDVPAEQRDGYDQGWRDNYWEPMQAYFASGQAG